MTFPLDLVNTSISTIDVSLMIKAVSDQDMTMTLMMMRMMMI